MIDKS